MQSTSILESFRLDGRRALVTGAGRGIGLGAAGVLAELGAAVTLVARTREDVEAAVEDIRAKGGTADDLVADVMDIEAMAAVIAEREPYNILFNNAGLNRINSFVDVKVEDFDYIFGLNVRAAFFVAQAVARKLIEARQTGSIINVSSQMGLVGAADRSVYCASKWALEGMTRAMAIDLAPHGIRVNTICPTFVATPMANRFLSNPEFQAFVKSKIKLGRVGEVRDLLGAIALLASDASSLMTGSSVVIDGGWTAD